MNILYGQLFAAYFYGPPCTRHFYARQHICYRAYMLSPVRPSLRPSVCLSVCQTGGSQKNGWS